jgi:hypothetical protein
MKLNGPGSSMLSKIMTVLKIIGFVSLPTKGNAGAASSAAARNQ